MSIVINITRFFDAATPSRYSASKAEIGENAGPVTWGNAVKDSSKWSFLDTDEKRDRFRDWISGYGAWSKEEIDAWSDLELNALFVQWIAGDMRECGMHKGMDDEEWVEITVKQVKGTYPSNIYRTEDGQVYFDLS